MQAATSCWMPGDAAIVAFAPEGEHIADIFGVALSADFVAEVVDLGSDGALLSIELAEAGNYRVAEGAGCECGICLNQRHLDFRIESFELPGAGSSREASANDDDAGQPLALSPVHRQAQRKPLPRPTR